MVPIAGRLYKSVGAHSRHKGAHLFPSPGHAIIPLLLQLRYGMKTMQRYTAP